MHCIGKKYNITDQYFPMERIKKGTVDKLTGVSGDISEKLSRHSVL